MRQSALNEIWERLSHVQESLPFTQHVHERLRRRRHEDGGFQGASRGTDPVLRSTEFSGRRGIPAHTAHQPLMELLNEAQRQRQGAETPDTVLQGSHVVPHLSNIARNIARGRLVGALMHENIRDARARTLDAR